MLVKGTITIKVPSKCCVADLDVVNSIIGTHEFNTQDVFKKDYHDKLVNNYNKMFRAIENILNIPISKRGLPVICASKRVVAYISEFIRLTDDYILVKVEVFG